MEETNETKAMKAPKVPEIPEMQVERTVRIKIPRSREEQGDVFVSVNDRTWLIKRGVEVDVPECVAEVLRNQEDMLEERYRFEERASR